MNKEVIQHSLLYVDNKKRPLQVRMHTDENSEVCTIRFGNSYTLGVVTPQDLMALANEINEFAKQAYELHYTEEFAVTASSSTQRMLQAMKSTAESGDKPFGEYDPDDPVNW